MAAETTSAGWCTNSLDLSSLTDSGAWPRGFLASLLESLSSTNCGTLFFILCPFDVSIGGAAGLGGAVFGIFLTFCWELGRSNDCIGVFGVLFKSFLLLSVGNTLSFIEASVTLAWACACLASWSLIAFRTLNPL